MDKLIYILKIKYNKVILEFRAAFFYVYKIKLGIV
jgi:hypothetical protein